MEQLRERSREGRKETNRKPSTRTWKEGTRDQAGEKGETEEARAETGTGKAAGRRNREEKERKDRRLSSRKRKRSGRKEAERKWKIPEAKVEGKHLRNSCGSESGKGERKRTVEPSTRTEKEDTGNQVGENGESQGSESGEGAPRKPL